ncbi:MAG: hypothetical protein K2I42_06365 [Anaeroplasmataceae bacterium]|nr:hypothetical protein [Anaeroplasmataceae bacterium]
MNLLKIQVPIHEYNIAFKCNNKNICDIEPFKKNLNLFSDKLTDANQASKDVLQTGHHGNGDYSVDINCIDKIDYLMTLIRQSYKLSNFYWFFS